MSETVNAICVLLSLIGTAAVTAGWLIAVFSSLFKRRWLDALLCLLFLPALFITWQREQKHAYWMLATGIALLAIGFGGAFIIQDIYTGSL